MMRKFRFVGTEQDASEYSSPKPVVGEIYNETDVVGHNYVLDWWGYNKSWDGKEWEEVVEEKSVWEVEPFDLNYSPNFDENVNVHINPRHYKNGKVECIDAIESAVVGKVGIEATCVSNIIKYLWRYEDKNGVVDVKKAKWYLDKLINVIEERNNES
jgi:hypothetical protein